MNKLLEHPDIKATFDKAVDSACKQEFLKLDEAFINEKLQYMTDINHELQTLSFHLDHIHELSEENTNVQPAFQL